MLSNKRILVTGANGFLGRHLMAELPKYFSSVEPYRADVRTIEQSETASDVVCHLAAVTKATTQDEYDSLFDVNVGGTLSVMRYCYRYKASCVLISSSAVYLPSDEEIPLSEKAPRSAKTIYGASKSVCEEICEYYSTYLNVAVTALRIFNLYGEGQRNPFLIPSLIYSVRHHISGEKSLTLNTPFLVRDFIHVRDVVSAILYSLRDTHSGWRCFNVGTGRGISVLQVLHKILEIEEIDHQDLAKSQINVSENSEKNFVIADVQKFKEAFSWKPRVPIEEGLRLMMKAL